MCRSWAGVTIGSVCTGFCLRILPGVFGDDLHAVLVGADRAVGSKTVENRACGLCRLDRESLVDGKAAERYVVFDAESKAVSSCEGAVFITLGQFIEGGLRHRWREIL